MLMKQFSDRCRSIEFLAELIECFDPSEEQCDQSISKLQQNTYYYGNGKLDFSSD